MVNRREKKSVTKEGTDSNGPLSSNGWSSGEQEDGNVGEEATVATSYPVARSGSMACSSTVDDIGDAAPMYEKNEHVRNLAGINGLDVATTWMRRARIVTPEMPALRRLRSRALVMMLSHESTRQTVNV